MSLYIKDPDAVLDYKWDWSSWLAAGETITTSTVTVPAGITKDSATNTTTAATVWLSGGTKDTHYTVTNRIVTNQGRTDDRSITIRVVDR